MNIANGIRRGVQERQLFDGNVPAWKVPDGIVFEKWAEDMTKWIMFTTEPIEVRRQENDREVDRQNARAREILEQLK